jgi:hypothetical protein
MRISLSVFKYLSQTHTHNSERKKEAIFGLVFVFFLRGEYTTHKEENMYIYLQKITNRDMKRELKFIYLFKVVDVGEYLLIIMVVRCNASYVVVNVLVIIELLLVVNVRLDLRYVFEEEMIHLRFVHDDEHLDLILVVNLDEEKEKLLTRRNEINTMFLYSCLLFNRIIIFIISYFTFFRWFLM